MLKKENKKDTAKKQMSKEEKQLIKKNNKDSKMQKFIETINNKWLIKGVTTVLLVAIIIGIYIGVTAILNKVTLPEIDCTSNKIYTLSDETKTKVKELDKKVNITLINYQNNESVIETVEKYKALNKNIEVERVDDLTSRTDLMQKYSLTSTDSLIVVSSEDRNTTISSSSLTTYDYETGKDIDITEEAITNAIVQVTTEAKPKVYFMENHEMYPAEAFTTLTKALKDDANDVTTVDLLAQGKVPDDCDTLVITTLKEDITEAEKDSLNAYINKGGKLLVMFGSTAQGIDLTNFKQVLDLYGLGIGEGTILEGNTSNILSGYSNIIIESSTQNSTTEKMNMNIKGCFIGAAPITQTADADKLDQLQVEQEDLMLTTNKAFVRTNLGIKTATRTEADSAEGVQKLGVMATKKINDDTSSKLILYSNDLFASDMVVPFGQYQAYAITLYNNEDLASNSIAFLNNRGNIITIRKNYDSVTYNVTEKQNRTILEVIFIVPVVIIIAGIVVWQIRKHMNK